MEDKPIYKMNINAVLIVNACKKVVESAEKASEHPEELVTATYQLDCLMCELKNKVE